MALILTRTASQAAVLAVDGDKIRVEVACVDDGQARLSVDAQATSALHARHGLSWPSAATAQPIKRVLEMRVAPSTMDLRARGERLHHRPST